MKVRIKIIMSELKELIEMRNNGEEEKNQKKILQDSTRIVISPINQNSKSNSCIDYNEQLERIANNKQLMWDDTKFNKQIKGGLFIFCKNRTMQYKGSVHIHIVEEVYPPSERLPSWSNNVGQGDRNVLFISTKSVHYDWDKWINMGGPKKVQGTAHIIKNKKNIIDHINNDMELMKIGGDMALMKIGGDSG